MNAGRILQSGSPSEVFAAPESPFVAHFLGYDNLIAGHISRIHGRDATLRSDSFDGEMAAVVPASVTPPPVGDPIWIAVRAEDIRIYPTTERTDGLVARVEDIVRLGSSAEVVLQSNGHRVNAHVASCSVASLRTGDEVAFSADQSAAVVVPRADEPQSALAS